MLQRGAGNRHRPDAVFDQGDRVILLEVDEYSHRGYSASAERQRMDAVTEALSPTPVVWLRFNPDRQGATLQERVDCLVRCLDLARDVPAASLIPPNDGYYCAYVCYNEQTGCIKWWNPERFPVLRS